MLEEVIEEGAKKEKLPEEEKEPKEKPETDEEFAPKKKLKIKLRDGKEREIQHMIQTSFWGADGKPISSEEFLNSMFGALPEFFKNEAELRRIWSNPKTRKAFLQKLDGLGFGADQLEDLQKVVNAQNSDLFDALAYVAFLTKPISRVERVESRREKIFDNLDEKQKEFLEFVLKKYVDEGVDELAEDRLSKLLDLKYHAISDAERELGGVEKIRSTFFDFQKILYSDLRSGDEIRM